MEINEFETPELREKLLERVREIYAQGYICGFKETDYDQEVDIIVRIFSNAIEPCKSTE